MHPNNTDGAINIMHTKACLSFIVEMAKGFESKPMNRLPISPITENRSRLIFLIRLTFLYCPNADCSATCFAIAVVSPVTVTAYTGRKSP